MGGPGLALPAARGRLAGEATLVVSVHGGPASAAKNTFDDKLLVLVSQGYDVLAPNPRGSFGQGEAFTRGQREGLRATATSATSSPGVDAAARAGSRWTRERVGIPAGATAAT